MNHRQAWDLIPWYVNGSAPESRCGQLQEHLSGCAQCREEVAIQRTLQQAMKTRPLVENMPHGSLHKLWERIDAEPDVHAPEPPARAPAPAHSQRMVAWLAAATAVQALLLGAVILGLLRLPQTTEDARFRTVTAPAAAVQVPSVRAVFSPDMTLGELQALLERARLRIVNGPTPEGVYTLAPTQTTAADSRQALVTLRSHPATRFAEPIGP